MVLSLNLVIAGIDKKDSWQGINPVKILAEILKKILEASQKNTTRTETI
jgi:hypothetical protein